MTNRLGESLSPYLRSHADNPVDWWPWGEEAFAEARRRDVPVLISVGYAACHWCHVMAHESFEDPQTAELINENFVAIKVDREEHPDVDAVYMLSTQALTGRGGWPMTVFADPDGRPFYAGTYFPPQPRHGMPSFSQVLQSVAATWSADRERVDAASGRIASALVELQDRGRGGVGAIATNGPVHETSAGQALGTGIADLERISAQASDMLAAGFDQRHAGFGGAPKFPPTMALQFLLRRYQRCADSRDLEMVVRTCEAMAAGGMYDQLAGGFARYSVDAAWVVPHFEKMLYDNAQLLALYARLDVIDPHPRWTEVAVACGDFLLESLQVGGGFASALDADAVPAGAPPGTRAEEGASYVWTPAQLADALGPDDAKFVAGLCEVTTSGTFEHGSSVLQMRHPPPPGTAEADRWVRCRALLLAARDARPQPARDGKVVVAWNGLTISGLAQAGSLLGERRFVDAAVAAAEALHERQWVDGRLRRVSLDWQVGDAPGVLEDYACLAQGLIDLYAVTSDVRHVQWAGELLAVAERHFSDGSGGYFDTADDAPGLLLRPSDPSDNVSPSGWSAMAGALLSYAALTGSASHRLAAERAMRVPLQVAETSPRAAGWTLAVAEALIAGPAEVAVVGADDDPDRRALAEAAWRLPSPGAVVAVGLPDGTPGAAAQSSVVPLLAHRTLVDDHAAAYVCRGFTCQAPVTDPTALLGLS